MVRLPDLTTNKHELTRTAEEVCCPCWRRPELFHKFVSIRVYLWLALGAFLRRGYLTQFVSRIDLGLLVSRNNCIDQPAKLAGVPLFSRLPPLASARVSQEITHRSLEILP